MEGWPHEFGANSEDAVTESEISSAKDRLRSVVNPIGRLLIAGELESVSLLDLNLKRHWAGNAATRVVLACELFRRAKRTEAPTLKAIVDAKLLDAVPEDPFDGKPMRYDAARHVVWSVGPDGKDDGGRVGRILPGFGRDLTWLTVAPPPRERL
jgi:hypothetical protein